MEARTTSPGVGDMLSHEFAGAPSVAALKRGED